MSLGGVPCSSYMAVSVTADAPLWSGEGLAGRLRDHQGVALRGLLYLPYALRYCTFPKDLIDPIFLPPHNIDSATSAPPPQLNSIA